MSSAEENLPAQRVRLTDLPIGEAGRVCGLEGKTEVCQRLREMGFCESAVIEKVSGASTLLCDRAAQHIVVEQIRRTA